MLQFCRAEIHYLGFALFFKAKYFIKIYLLRKTNHTLKWRGGQAAPPIYFISTLSRRVYFGEVFYVKNLSQNPSNDFPPCRIVAVGLSPTLDSAYFVVCLCHSGCCVTRERACVPQESCVLSRVGDRPTATILHAQFHFYLCLDFSI